MITLLNQPEGVAMTQSDLEYTKELQPAFLLTILAVGVTGIFLAMTSDTLFPSNWAAVAEIALLCFAIAVTAWIVQSRWLTISQWFTVVSLAVLIYFASQRLAEPSLVTWLVLPNILAITFLGFRAGLALSVVETGFILSGENHPGLTTLGIVWLALIACGIFSYSTRSVVKSALNYYRHANEALQESHDRQLTLNQALNDLATANQQLSQMNIQAQRLGQIAEEARITKEQFVANVSHELRTPLNMIIGFTEMILEVPDTYGGRIPHALLADLTVIQRNAQHLSALIDDVLDLSQIDMDKMALTKEIVKVSELIETAITTVRPLFETKNLVLETQVAEDLPAVTCDPTRIREVLLNLLSNAGRFTEKGGVLVKAWVENNHLQVSVADTGPGISDEGMRNLFQPFYQVDGSIRRRFGGTGLGLSISKRIIDLHDGRLWVESTPGQGTVFTFRIPIATVTPARNILQEIVPDWEYHERRQPTSAPRPALKPRFVVVESGTTLQRLMKRYLNSADIEKAAGLPEAIQLLENHQAQALFVNTHSLTATLETLSPAMALPKGIPAFICSIPEVNEPDEELGVASRLTKPILRAALLETLRMAGIEKGTVLIVDDEPDDLQLFGRMLASQQNEYRTLIARDGVEALEILEQVRPDVILLDLVMPNMDGFQFLEERGRNPEFRNIPVIIVSAQDSSNQPIVSSSFAMTQGGGLSISQLVDAIQFTSRSAMIKISTGGLTRQSADPG
jgi:signal transduction histidine kinase/CheY-like chemotaxis protein